MAGRILPVVPETRMLKSLKAASIGVPEKLLVLPADVAELPLGIIAARATHVKKTIAKDPRTDQEKEYIALAGSFAGWSFREGEAHNILPARRPEVRAGLLYLPEGIAELFHDQVNSKGEDTDAVQFIIVLGVQRANNPRKYSWFANYLLEPIEDKSKPDPLIALMNQARALQIEYQASDDHDEEVDEIIEQPKPTEVARKSKR